MALTVKSATYGDESSVTNVRDVVSSKLKDGRINLRVDDSIVPTFSFSSEGVSLTDDEKATIREQAIKECNSASDTQCIQATVNRISQGKLDEKMLEQQRAGAVKGNRLNVTFVDRRGREITRMIPKGQDLIMGQPPKAPVKPPGPSIGSQIGSALTKFFLSSATVFGVIGTIVFIILWVFSVGATWKTFMEAGMVKQGYAFTAISVIVPLSGLILTPGYFAFLKYYSKAK